MRLNKRYSKAETLFFLKKFENKFKFKIPKFFYITKKDFNSDYEKFYKKVLKLFKSKKIILRSSSLDEDNLNHSNAGKYKSFSNISLKDKNKIIRLAKEIIKDFKNSKDQILVQEFVKNPTVSGVIFTRDINNNSPYCTINYDLSGKTNLITSGKQNPSMKTIVLFKNKINNFNFFGQKLKILNSIEKIVKNSRLDIEFCIKGKIFFLLQCRPLKKIQEVEDNEIEETLINIKKKIKKLKKPLPNVIGKSNCFSNMSDWNPAEMIGIRPLPLALSLYSELITDEIWSKQRADYGYKDVTPNRLMFSLAGLPYIDVRTDFNSFLPAKLPISIQKKAINYYIKNLKKFPSNHDKIEFNNVETCYDFDTREKFKNFLSDRESKIYLQNLREITNKVFSNKDSILEKEMKKINLLNIKINTIKNSNLSEIQKIFFLIDDCKKYGTLPFAGIARSAFVYTKIIKTLVKKKIISEEDHKDFYESCDTLTKNMFFFLKNIKNAKRRKLLFLKKYGHLRPSTYSINSKNYTENFKKYFSNISNIIVKKKKNFKLSKSQIKKIDNLFLNHNLKIDCKNFFVNAKRSIQYRESAKFTFSRSIDEIFVNLISLAKEINLDRNDLDYVSIKNFINYYSNVNVQKLKKILKNEIEINKSDQKILNLLHVPEFISEENDLYLQKESTKLGTYITNYTISGQVINFKSINNYKKLSNRIVLLENADPGYDFIFSHKIKGLITRYGGANSHMSIRSLELGIPAIIGIGSKDFNLINGANFIEINCRQKFYKIIT